MNGYRIMKCCVVALALMGMAHPAAATTMLFQFEGVVSGSIDGVDFTDEAFVVTTTADTADITSFSDGFSVLNDSATLEFPNLNGGTVLDVVDPTTVNVNTTVGAVTFGNDRTHHDNVLAWDPAFTAWDLTSPIGPITDDDGFLQTPAALQTLGGDLRFADATAMVTFQASVVPEPATLVLLLAGGVALMRRRN